MSDSLEEMWSHLSLIDEEQTDVLVEKEWVNDASKISKRSLLGKLLIRKPMNVEVMKIVFMKIWKISSSLTIREVGERLSLFNFGVGWKRIEFFKDNLGRSTSL